MAGIRPGDVMEMWAKYISITFEMFHFLLHFDYITFRLHFNYLFVTLQFYYISIAMM